MPISPQDLLRKLKPTANFDVDRASILALARIAISEGEEAFVTAWAASFAPKTKRVSPSKAAASRGVTDAVLDPRTKAAEDQLKKFAKSRKLKAAEGGVAFVRFARTKLASLPEPTKASTNSIPSAVKWVSQKAPDTRIDDLATLFVETFAGETDYTYR